MPDYSLESVSDLSDAEVDVSDVSDELDDEQRPQFLERYCIDSSKWKQYLTENVYVPISFNDLNNLHKVVDVVRLHDQYISRNADLPLNVFFGNHPIKFVQIIGHVLDITYPTEYETVAKLAIEDGLGPADLYCVVYKGHTFGVPMPDSPEPFEKRAAVQRGDLVLIWGKVCYFNYSFQISVHRLWKFAGNRYKLYYQLRQEIILVRKYVLEMSADLFMGLAKPRGMTMSPHTTVLDYAEKIPGLKTALANSNATWGYETAHELADYTWIR